MKAKNAKPTERNVSQIIITNNVIRLGSLVIPLTSVSQIEVHPIRKKSAGLIILSIIAGIATTFGLTVLNRYYEPFIPVGAGIAACILVLLVGRKIQKRKYALRIQSYTGQEDYVTTSDESFLEEIADEIHYAMENSGQPIQVIANIKNKTINKNEHIMGDKITASDKSNIVKNTGDGKITGVGNFSVGNDGNIELEKVQDSYNQTPQSVQNVNAQESEQALLKNDLRDQLANNQVDEVVQQLMDYFQKEERRDAIKTTILIQSRLQRIQMEDNMGVANPTEVTLQKTKVVADLLDVIDKEL